MKLIDLLVQELPKRGGWPEGAVECCWFRGEKDLDFFDVNGNWDRQPINPFDLSGVVFEPNEGNVQEIKKHEYESALSQQSAWNGEGLPPGGCECEAKYLRAANAEWFAFRCVAVDCEVAFGWGGKEPTNLTLKDFEFRPIRTEAERKRDEVIKHISHSLRANGSVTSEQLNRLYDDIATGKIPGVKLAD